VNEVEVAASLFVNSPASVEPFGGGHINETFLVRAPSEDLILQRVNQRVFADPDAMMANVLAVHRHLEGSLIPHPVPADDGRWLVRIGADAWRAWRRVPGGELARAATAATAGSAGRLLGRFHDALADFDATTLTTPLPGFHDPGRRLAELRAVVKADPRGRAHGVADEVESAFAAAALVERAQELTARVRIRATHNDAKLDNVLFRGAEAVCLVDLDTLMPGAQFWDVGDLVRTAATTAAEDDPSPDVAVEPHLYSAIIDGYRSGAGASLESPEIDALNVAGAIVTYEQAVRFLTDWIAGDIYYRIHRPEQNLDRARCQLRLLASMPGTVTAP
jgi:Ser/Thr protein kinase RdoA (MazF antagonist)